MAMMEVGSPATVHPGVTLNIEKEDVKDAKPSSSTFTREFSQKLIAELVATYFLVFAGCGSIMVDIDKNKLLGQPGVAITWGAAVMVMVYTVGHVSGAHINPAVTIAFASCKRFPWKEVPGYMIAQVLAAILASGTLRLIFSGKHDNFAGSAPPGSDFQALVVEIIITFYLMFVISAGTKMAIWDSKQVSNAMNKSPTANFDQVLCCETHYYSMKHPHAVPQEI